MNSQIVQQPSSLTKRVISPMTSYLTKQYQGLKGQTKTFPTAAILKANAKPEQKAELIKRQQKIKPFQFLGEQVKEFGSKLLLSLPDRTRELLKIMKRPDYKLAKKMVIDKYNLTPKASKLWDDAEFKMKDIADMPHGLYYMRLNIIQDLLPEKIAEKLPSEFWRILPPHYKPLIEIYKAEPEVILHELGHQLWAEGILEKKRRKSKVWDEFGDEWDSLNEKENYFTTYIDNAIHEAFVSGIHPETLASERFATMFVITGGYGIDEVPKSLRKYIKPFIK